MAKHAMPREIAELKGAVAHNPQRYRGKVPKSKLPLGEAPDFFTDEERECWDELSFCSLPGVLTGADRQILEITSCLLAEYRSDRPGFAVGKYTHLISGLARLGMSPADRQKMAVEKDDDEPPKFRKVS